MYNICMYNKIFCGFFNNTFICMYECIVFSLYKLDGFGLDIYSERIYLLWETWTVISILHAQTLILFIQSTNHKT